MGDQDEILILTGLSGRDTMVKSKTFDILVMPMNNKIKQLRKRLGLTQNELAAECGVTRQTINSVENNRYDPTLELAFKLAHILQTKVDELFIYE